MCKSTIELEDLRLGADCDRRYEASEWFLCREKVDKPAETYINQLLSIHTYT